VTSYNLIAQFPTFLSMTLVSYILSKKKGRASQTNKQTPWSESASELYRPIDRRLSAKLVPTFADRRCHVVSVTHPYSRIWVFQTWVATFSSKYLLSFTHEAEWTSFQTHYFSENLVASGIEPGHRDLQPGTLTTRPQRRSRKSTTRLLNSLTRLPLPPPPPTR
jgi:hypothetical protein